MKNKQYILTCNPKDLLELLPIKLTISDNDRERKLIWEDWLEQEHTNNSIEEIKRLLK